MVRDYHPIPWIREISQSRAERMDEQFLDLPEAASISAIHQVCVLNYNDWSAEYQRKLEYIHRWESGQNDQKNGADTWFIECRNGIKADWSRRNGWGIGLEDGYRWEEYLDSCWPGKDKH